MAYPQNDAALHKTFLASIHPSDRLHITIDLQQELEDEPWLPGMSVFSVNGPPVAQNSAQRDELLPRSPVPTIESPQLRTHEQAEARMRQMLIQHQMKQPDGQHNMAGMMQPQDDQNMTQQHCNIPSGFHTCPNSSDIMLQRDAPEEESNAIIHKSCCNPHGCISSAAVIDHMRKSGVTENSIRSASSSPALLDYNRQLMLLERQNTKRLAMANNTSPPVSGPFTRCGSSPPSYHGGCFQLDHIGQLKLLDQQQKKRLALDQEEQDYISKASLAPDSDEQSIKREIDPELKSFYEGPHLYHNFSNSTKDKEQEVPAHLNLPSLPALQLPAYQETHLCENLPSSHDHQSQRSQTSPSHQLWLSGPHALQDYETQRRLVEQHKTPPNGPVPANLALQDYQMQLMLLEQQNKKRKMIQDAEKLKADAKLAAQRQAIIQRHQANMSHWQSTQLLETFRKAPQELNPHTRRFLSDLYPPVSPQTSSSPAQDVAQPSLNLRQRSTNMGSPETLGLPVRKNSRELPIRPSKKALEQVTPDPDMDEWAKVERPQKRACSEESEVFSEGSDLVDLGSEC